MSKFLVLYRSSVSTSDQLANATPEQAKAGMDAWMGWARRSGDAVVDLGAPLGDGETVGSGDAPVCGFSILQADTPEAVAALLRDHPHLHMPGDSSIEVHEFVSLPGM
jgi:hypothetical protein